MKKKFFKSLSLGLLALVPAMSWAQDCVQVGNGTGQGYIAPFNNYYKNSWTQTIYSASDINHAAGQILSIAYQCVSGTTLSISADVKIYMGLTTKTEAASTTDWVPASDLKLVYSKSGYTYPSAAGWEEIALDIPFVYDGKSNIVVCVSNKIPTYDQFLKYAYTSVTNSTLYRRSDSNASYAEHPGDNAGTRETQRPNIQFCFPLEATLSETGDKADITALKDKKANVTVARTFYKDGERNSICLPFAVSADSLLSSTFPLYGCQLEEFSSAVIVNKGKENETLELTMTDASAIVAGKPYLITWASGENLVSPVFNNVTITTDEASASEKKEGVQFCGTFVPKAVTEGDKGVLFVGLGGALNWPNVGGNINGFRSYFTVDLDAQSPIRRGMTAVIGSKTTPTGMQNAECTMQNVEKLIQEGRVVIISNGVRYDLNGNIVK